MNVYPSPMILDMGDARKAYKMKLGYTAKMEDLDNVLQVEQTALNGLAGLELDVAAATPEHRAALINAYTRRIYDDAVARWAALEARFWQQFGLGF